MRILVGVASALVASALIAGPAAAAELSGRWDSDSLTDNGVGYYFELDPVPNTQAGYAGYLRFSYQDGRQGKKMPVRVKVSGDRLTFTAKKGFDKSGKVIKAKLSDTSEITFTNCSSRLTFAMPQALDSDCVFRPAAS